MAKASALKAAEDFFYQNAGSSYTPGKETKAQGQRRGAKALAKAEAYASAHGWTYDWEDEFDVDLSWADEEQKQEISEVLSCLLRDENGEVLGSLGNITFGHNSMQNRQYRRVVEAELAHEAMPQ